MVPHPQQVIFIHGMFVTNGCWDAWLPYFRNRGYEVSAPAWPCKNDTPENLRLKHPDIQGEGHVRLRDVVASFEDIIKTYTSPPILVGHSMGALVVQLLLNKGLGAAGVCIDSAPPLGVLTTKFSLFKANWPVLNPFTPKYKPVMWTEKQFQYAFADHLQGQALHDAFQAIVPQSKLVPRESLTPVAAVKFRAKTQPLLFIAGEKDKIIPSSLNKTNWRKYRKAPSVTDFKEFEGRRHNLIMDNGWEQIAEYAAQWIALHQVAR